MTSEVPTHQAGAGPAEPPDQYTGSSPWPGPHAEELDPTRVAQSPSGTVTANTPPGMPGPPGMFGVAPPAGVPQYSSQEFPTYQPAHVPPAHAAVPPQPVSPPAGPPPQPVSPPAGPPPQPVSPPAVPHRRWRRSRSRRSRSAGSTSRHRPSPLRPSPLRPSPRRACPRRPARPRQRPRAPRRRTPAPPVGHTYPTRRSCPRTTCRRCRRRCHGSTGERPRTRRSSRRHSSRKPSTRRSSTRRHSTPPHRTRRCRKRQWTPRRRRRSPPTRTKRRHRTSRSIR